MQDAVEKHVLQKPKLALEAIKARALALATPRKKRLLEALFAYPEKICSYDDLVAHVWGPGLEKKKGRRKLFELVRLVRKDLETCCRKSASLLSFYAKPCA